MRTFILSLASLSIVALSCQKTIDDLPVKINGCDSLHLGLLKPRTSDSVRLSSCMFLSGCDSIRLSLLKPTTADTIRLADCMHFSEADSLRLFPDVAYPASLRKGLVAYYPFTGNAGDSSGNGNNGTVNGPTLTTDRFGNAHSAYMFSGGTITAPHRSYLGFTQNGHFSVSIWAYKTGAENPAHFIGKRPQGAHEFNWQIAQHDPWSGLIFSGSASSQATGPSTFKDVAQNGWSHVVGVFDNGTWSIYLDGVLLASATSTVFYPDVNTPLEIGNSGGWGPFGGKLDDIRIYDRALTVEEIRYLSRH